MSRIEREIRGFLGKDLYDGLKFMWEIEEALTRKCSLIRKNHRKLPAWWHRVKKKQRREAAISRKERARFKTYKEYQDYIVQKYCPDRP